jgi:hypothetical protein
MLPHASLRAVRQVCDALGAEAFVDVLEIQQREGAEAAAERLRCALQRRCLGLSAP